MRSGFSDSILRDPNRYESVERLPVDIDKWELKKLGRGTYRVLPVMNGKTLDFLGSEVYVTRILVDPESKEARTDVRRVVSGDARGKALTAFLRKDRKPLSGAAA